MYKPPLLYGWASQQQVVSRASFNEDHTDGVQSAKLISRKGNYETPLKMPACDLCLLISPMCELNKKFFSLIAYNMV
jgi:hypothetical protein